MNDNQLQPNVLNVTAINFNDPATMTDVINQAKAMQNALDYFWDTVKTEMGNRSLSQIKGDWGSLSFVDTELLTAKDASTLDPAVTKPSLDTDKARAYRNLMGELPAGVSSRTITKFVKRVK